MHWAMLRVSIMFRNSIPVFVQYHLLISLDSVQVRFLAHPKTTSLALAHVHNMATLALKLSGRSLLYSKSASFRADARLLACGSVCFSSAISRGRPAARVRQRLLQIGDIARTLCCHRAAASASDFVFVRTLSYSRAAAFAAAP